MALLERGLAKLHPSFDPERDSNGVALVAAESAARDRKIKVCSHHTYTCQCGRDAILCYSICVATKF